MKGNMTELAPQPQKLDVIPLHRTAQQIVDRGRHKRIRHKRDQRDRYIDIMVALSWTGMGFMIGYIVAMAYCLWAMGVI